MTRYLPTSRGWAALLTASLGGGIYGFMVPVRYVQSGFGTFLGEPVSPAEWVSGGVLIFLCVAACLEAFRRGSRVDRIVACVAGLLTFLFVREFLSLLFLPVRQAPV